MAEVFGGPNHDFGHCQSSEEHAGGTNQLERYDFLLVFYSDLSCNDYASYKPSKLAELKSTGTKTRFWALPVIGGANRWYQVTCEVRFPISLP